jgi:hypothetical protein
VKRHVGNSDDEWEPALGCALAAVVMLLFYGGVALLSWWVVSR